jgi:sugar phosphate isomerase/epimerase
MLRIGLNPYGVTYTVGLQQRAEAHPRPAPIGMTGFIALARELGAKCIELDCRWLTPLTDVGLAELKRDLGRPDATVICSDWLKQETGETLAAAIRCASLLGAPILRLHLTPVLEGGRARSAGRWAAMIRHARATLKREAARAADHGVILAVENHQDLTSEELIDIAEASGDNVRLVLDTGNPFAVGEDPLEFTRRAAGRVSHVHLKDYVAQFTDQGYRLVRCAIGEGCVPFKELAALLPDGLTASIEPGALDARHIRMFAPEWWDGYPPRQAREVGVALGRLRRARLADAAEWRTPWERHAPGAAIVDYELGQLRRSVEHLRAMGWM